MLLLERISEFLNEERISWKNDSPQVALEKMKKNLAEKYPGRSLESLIKAHLANAQNNPIKKEKLEMMLKNANMWKEKPKKESETDIVAKKLGAAFGGGVAKIIKQGDGSFKIRTDSHLSYKQVQSDVKDVLVYAKKHFEIVSQKIGKKGNGYQGIIIVK